jgi:hypothetical protein
MRFTLKKATWLIGIVAIGLVEVGVSQDISRHFISVKSGMVNYVEGNPEVIKSGKDIQKALAVRQQLAPGDLVRSHELDRLELLLNPGSYLRISGKAMLEVNGTDFETMRYSLKEGKAILESITFNKKLHSLWINTNAGQLHLLEEGLYRMEALPDNSVQVAVYSGKLGWVQGQKPMTTLKKGKMYLLHGNSGGPMETAGLDKTQLDAFDSWSKERDQYLVAANSRIPSWMRSTVYSAYGSGFRGGWIFNPLYGAFTFLPYDYYFSSPYGFRYFNYDPYFRPYYNGGGGGTSGGNAGGGSYTPSAATVAARTSSTTSISASTARVSAGNSEVSSRGSTRSH